MCICLESFDHIERITASICNSTAWSLISVSRHVKTPVANQDTCFSFFFFLFFGRGGKKSDDTVFHRRLNKSGVSTDEKLKFNSPLLTSLIPFLVNIFEWEKEKKNMYALMKLKSSQSFLINKLNYKSFLLVHIHLLCVPVLALIWYIKWRIISVKAYDIYGFECFIYLLEAIILV